MKPTATFLSLMILAVATPNVYSKNYVSNITEYTQTQCMSHQKPSEKDEKKNEKKKRVTNSQP